MAFAQIVTGGRVTTGERDTPAYAAGSIGDLILVIASVSTADIDSSVRHYDVSSLPAGWTLVAGGEAGGADEYAKIIIARVADSADAGMVYPPISAGWHSAVSYRFETETWEGTIAGGVDAAFVGTESYDPPSLAHGWGSADVFWLAGLGSRETKYEFETTPTGFTTLTDSRATLSGNDTFSRVVSMEREENATSIDPSAFSITAGSNTPEGVYAFTVAVRPAETARVGVRITDIKEANESDTLVDDVSNARVMAWHTAQDEEEPDNVVSAQSITAGVLEVELPGATLAETATITVDWGTFFFRATATIIDLDA